MTLTNIRYFIEAARYENFTEAARTLFVSQPSFSKQIALVEKEVGVPLFFRVNRGVRLTPAGRYLYDQLKDLVSHAEMAFEHAREIGRNAEGVLSVGILEGQEVNSIIAKRLNAFTEAFPGLDLRYERSSFSRLRKGLESGHYDLVITLSFEIEYMPGTLHETIVPSQGAIAINRRNAKAAVEDLTLDMLTEENFVVITPEESPNGYMIMLKQCSKYGFVPRIVRQLSSLENLLLSVEAGTGIALLDRNTRLEKDSSVRIVPIPNSDSSHVCAVWLECNRNPLVRELARAMSAEAAPADR
jgi:DNA-binding transcriptional LysR family regulator